MSEKLKDKSMVGTDHSEKTEEEEIKSALNEDGVNADEETVSEERQAADTLLDLQTPAERAGYFRILYLPSLLYAAVYTLCMFQNSSGITMPLWTAAAAVYACMAIKNIRRSDRQNGSGTDAGLKAGSGIYIGIMLLLGTASFLTDNAYIIFFNYCGFFVILPAFLLHNFYDDSRWGFAKNLTETLAAVFGAVCCMFTPFTDWHAFYQESRIEGRKKESRTMRAVFAGIAAAVPGLFVLGACLMDADAVFAAMIKEILAEFRFADLRFAVKAFQMLAMLAFGFFSSYCGIRYVSLRSRNAACGQPKQFEPVTAVTFTGLISAMYLVFCTIQMIYLFAGNMRLPAGMTYAEYARSGFFQLLFVCAVNFFMVLLIKKYFLHHRVLDGMLLIICACTFVMEASSAYRMFLYIRTYQLTFLRVLVLAALFVLAFLTAGAVIMIVKPQFPLFRYSTAVVSAVYLCLAFSHADYFIASYNLAHAAENPEHMDWQYLAQLSLDAAPAAAQYYAKSPENRKEQMKLSAERAEIQAETSYGSAADAEAGNDIHNCEKNPIQAEWFASFTERAGRYEKNMGLRNFNVSRYIACKKLNSELSK